MKALSPKFAILLIASVLASLAHADTGMFGPEFTFSNSDLLYSGDGIRKAAARMGIKLEDQGKKYSNRQHYITRLREYYDEFCKTNDCNVSMARVGERFEFVIDFSDGWWFGVGTDQNVIEVGGPKQTVAEIEANEGRLQAALFDVMEKQGLEPKSKYGSGHMNMDFKTVFDEDINLVASFTNDIYNHPGLMTGIFEFDPYNAPRIQVADQFKLVNLDAWLTLVADVRSKKVRSSRVFGKRVAKTVALDYNSKNIAVNLSSLSLGESKESQRVELRALRAQRSAREWTYQTKLIQARVDYIKKLHAEGKVVDLLPRVGVNSPFQAMSQFYFYVTDAGLDFDIYKREIARGAWKYIPARRNRDAAYRDGNWCNWLLTKIETEVVRKVRGR